MPDSIHPLFARLAWLLAALALAFCGQFAAAAQVQTTYLFVLEADLEQLAERTDKVSTAEEIMRSSMEIARRRFEGLEVELIRLERQGQHRLVVELGRSGNRSVVEDVFGVPKDLRFRLVSEPESQDEPNQRDTKEETELYPMKDGTPPMRVNESGGINGSRLIGASASIDAASGENVLLLQFDELGKTQLAELSAAHVGQRMAVILEGEIITAPTILEPIGGGQMQLTGSFTAQSANELAISLRSGALPAPFKIVEERLQVANHH